MNVAPNVKEIAIQRALTLLNSAGAKYKVIFEGAEYGELIAVTKPDKKPRVKQNDFASLYIDKLKAMQVGDVNVWEHDNPEGLRSAITATSSRLWGNGSAISRVFGKTVELLRVC